MNIHEYQAKQLLAKYGVAVPLEIPAKSPDEIRAAAEKITAGSHGGGENCGVQSSGHRSRRHAIGNGGYIVEDDVGGMRDPGYEIIDSHRVSRIMHCLSFHGLD